MNNLDLPPFPVLGTSGSEVCEAVRFYLAIVDELSFEQVRILSEHVKGCEACATEYRLLQLTTRILAGLPESIPSTRVDNAVQAFLHSQQPIQHSSTRPVSAKLVDRQPRSLPNRKRASSSRRRVGMLALVAAILVVLGLSGILLRGVIWPVTNTPTFLLPTNLSWNGYVLHYTQPQKDVHGNPYQIEVYQDLGTNQMHIESSMKGTFDVVVVTDQQKMLGKDMMHHIAQEGQNVANWAIDGSVFELNRLRQDLTTRRTVYLGKSTFANQEVYQLRASNGQILLLNMHYLPVNVLITGSKASTPLYTTCELMPTAQVADSMWDMQVPSNFRMGQLPTKS